MHFDWIQESQTYIFPGSDDEYESDIEVPKDSQLSAYSTFRDFQPHAIMDFSASWGNKEPKAGLFSCGKYIYESIMILWLQAWSDFIESGAEEKSHVPVFAATSQESVLLDFFRHIDILLPLCLKSLALRYSVEVQRFGDPLTKAILDRQHMSVMTHFVDVLARGVMGLALSYSDSSSVPEAKDNALLQALATSEYVADFFEGLFAIIHPENMRCLIEKYFEALNECEADHVKENAEFDWTEQKIHRAKCSRQLRLRAVERLAVIPFFLALNVPPKFAEKAISSHLHNGGNSSWKMQYTDNANDPTSKEDIPLQFRRASNSEKCPESMWLARLLADEAFSICSLSCEAVVASAVAHIEFSNTTKSLNQGERLKKLPGMQLERGDLLMFQSISIHAITVAYELLLRRHAMDRRFQTDICRGRIAALYADSLFSKSIQSVRWLARMESTHKVRSLWMLCLIYVLQEAPEVLIRDLIRSYCDPTVRSYQ